MQSESEGVKGVQSGSEGVPGKFNYFQRLF